MSKPNDGGPAYPTPDVIGAESAQLWESGKPGMSLRDWFAGQIMAGALTSLKNRHGRMAKDAYAMADALLAARDGEQS